MKVLTIIGARPQFIKAAAVSRKLREIHDEVLVHTGQHYDSNMSQIFFDELDIPAPDYHLGVGSGLHGAQTGAMLSAIEEVLIKERPERVMVYGDTNSTLAGALAAAKLHVPVAHIEAGLRSFNKAMPEEINRVVADHVSDMLFCPSETAVANLAREGITRGVYCVGDVMYESMMHAVPLSRVADGMVRNMGIREGEYWLATIHRAENTDDPSRLEEIMRALNELAAEVPVVFPVHPRTRLMLGQMKERIGHGLKLIDPVGYADMLWLLSHATGVLTDSGGMQKEAYWMHIPCITLRDETEWTETVEQGWNVLAGATRKRILECARKLSRPTDQTDAYQGHGSVERLVRAFEQ